MANAPSEKTLVSEPEITSAKLAEKEKTLAKSVELEKFQEKSGTCSVGNPTFANLLNQVTSIKLDRENFLIWQNVVLPFLKSYKLEGHLTGKCPAPEMSIVIPPSEEEPKSLLIPNPEYDIWLTADQLLVGWLYNSMTAKIAAQVIGHDEAKLLWDSIQEYYGVQSRSQEDYYRQMLQQTRKGSMKMTEYLTTMKKYFDNLQLTGYPLDMRSFISYIIAGLDEEYTYCVCNKKSEQDSE